MSKILQPSVLRVVLLPLLGAAGAFVAMIYPVGYNAFCSGLSAVTI